MAKKINFSNVRWEATIGEFSIMDARKDVGNMLFINAPTLELDELARKIYNSTNEGIILTEEEFSLMMNTLLQGKAARYSLIKALRETAVDVTADDIRDFEEQFKVNK